MQLLVKVPEEYATGYKIQTWLLENVDFRCYRRLYYHESHADGEWHSNPKYLLAYIEFTEEEDAVAFKLRWT